MSNSYALIEGSGFRQSSEDGFLPETPYGQPSAPIRQVRRGRHELFWLPRHGDRHSIPPHGINYRANLFALHELGVSDVIGLNTVGVITTAVSPGDIALPVQLIDYTWGREQSFEEGAGDEVVHIEFAEPFAAPLRDALLAAAGQADVPCVDGGVYAVVQGPRLETAAEVDRLERDGADMVGMTAMPEAALAAELGMRYACIALAVNPAAGRTDRPLHDEVLRYSRRARQNAESVLDRFFSSAS
ncbi:MAG: S-methyl-5'-thioinosine phosphorylase [Pseudomonadota bacterium]